MHPSLFSLGTPRGRTTNRSCSQECALQGWRRRLHGHICDERSHHEASVFHDRQTVVRGIKKPLQVYLLCLIAFLFVFCFLFLLREKKKGDLITVSLNCFSWVFTMLIYVKG